MIMPVIFGILYEDACTNPQLDLICVAIFALFFSISLPLLVYYITDRMIDNPKPSKKDTLVSVLLTVFVIFFVIFFNLIFSNSLMGPLYFFIMFVLLFATSAYLLAYYACRTVDKPELSKKDILILILISALMMSLLVSLLIPALQ